MSDKALTLLSRPIAGWTRRGAIGAGLATGAVGLPAWAQSGTPSKIVIGKSGHVFALIKLGQQDCYALLDNATRTALSTDAPILGAGRRLDIDSAPKNEMFAHFGSPYFYKLGNAQIEFVYAMRGLSNYSKANGVPVHMVLGDTLFDTCVVELDFKAGAIAFHQRGYAPGEGAVPFPADEKDGKRGVLRIPVSFGPDGEPEAQGLADVVLGYSSLIRVFHPKVTEWVKASGKTGTQTSTTVMGSLAVSAEQVTFQSPPLRVGPFGFGRVLATADPTPREETIALLGVAALRPFKVWIDAYRGRIWLKQNTV
ncbi:MAG TPA: hypothetical protein VG942_14450 [Hyphomonadaceae bacterium]|nr:hypothetical protein [Hyphomonadaceae bacterium]